MPRLLHETTSLCAQCKNALPARVVEGEAGDVWMEKAEMELTKPSSSIDHCTPEEHLSLRRYADAINERLGSTADWQAEVFVLRHIENLSIQEISRRTSRSRKR